MRFSSEESHLHFWLRWAGRNQQVSRVVRLGVWLGMLLLRVGCESYHVLCHLDLSPTHPVVRSGSIVQAFSPLSCKERVVQSKIHRKGPEKVNRQLVGIPLSLQAWNWVLSDHKGESRGDIQMFEHSDSRWSPRSLMTLVMENHFIKRLDNFPLLRFQPYQNVLK